jgi:hypothetical protein
MAGRSWRKTSQALTALLPSIVAHGPRHKRDRPLLPEPQVRRPRRAERLRRSRWLQEHHHRLAHYLHLRRRASLRWNPIRNPSQRDPQTLPLPPHLQAGHRPPQHRRHGRHQAPQHPDHHRRRPQRRRRERPPRRGQETRRRRPIRSGCTSRSGMRTAPRRRWASWMMGFRSL